MKKKSKKQILRSVLNCLYLCPYSRLQRVKKNPDVMINKSVKTKVAFICDEMTWIDYSGYVTSVFLHPKTWKEQLTDLAPDVLFCESAWCGIDKYLNCWRGRVYKDKRLFFENRKVLLEILSYCKEKNIKTVFWNKEDPIFFQHQIYDFTDTALHFDYIFTTAIECIDKYYKLGHKNVYLLPFGVNTNLFNTVSRNYKPKTVIFAGSWFSDQSKRCADLEAILDYVIAKGWKLDIYDRKSECKGNRFRFPSKYKRYIRQAVPYSSIPELCKKYEFAINVNTVTESETMFSRRLLQMIMCGITVISNYSVAFSKYTSYFSYSFVADNIVSISGNINEIGNDFSTELQMRKLLESIEPKEYLINVEKSCEKATLISP